jgi:hypothetical protein
MIASIVLTGSIALSTYTFKWPAVKLTYSVSAETWPDAFEQAVDFCVKELKDSKRTSDLDDLSITDICVNPKQ